MSTFTHTNADHASNSALQSTNQLPPDPIDPVIDSTGQQDEVHGIHTVDPSLGGHDILAAEGADIAANTAEHTEQSRASKAVFDNTIYFPSAAAVAEHKTSQTSPEEPEADVEHIVSPELSQTDPIFGQKVFLSNIMLECSQPHHFEDNVTLVVMQDGEIYQTLHFAKGSPTQSITADTIALPPLAHADVTLCLQSGNGNDEAFYTITMKEIYAITSAVEGTAVKHEFTLLNGDNSGGVKMTSLVSTHNRLKALQILEEIEALELCFDITKNVDKITQAIFLYKRLVPEYASYINSVENVGLQDNLGIASTPSYSPNLAPWCNNLGNAYRRRFERAGNIQDIEDAISQLQQAVKSTPSHSPNLASRCNSLGNAYRRRFERAGNIHDIDNAICQLQQAVKSTPSDSPDLAPWCNNLGNAYRRRFERAGNIQDIEDAISQFQQAVKSTPSDSADYASRCSNLGSAYVRRFERAGNIQDMEDAISQLQQAVKSTPSDSPDLAPWCNNLGNAYRRRFERSGKIQDIEDAISQLQQAVKSTPSDSPNLPSWCNNLGIAYMRRFERAGNIQDIEDAISQLQQAVESTPSDSPHLASWCSNLGIAYMDRFKRAGNIQDMEDAISQLQQAVKSTPSDSPNLASRCNSLGNAYMNRFERAGNIQDIEDAISQLQQAVKSTPSYSPNLASLRSTLGIAYMRRFERAGKIQDIEDAISQLQQAVKSTPLDSPNLPSWCNNLGNAYRRRFERAGNIQDIEDAISQLQQAVNSTPSDSPDFASWCNNLGNSYKLRFNHLHNISDLEKCIHILADAAVANGPPSKHLDYAKAAAFMTILHSPPLDPKQCLTYFSTAVDLLAEVAGLEQTIHHRYINLTKYSGLVSQAVAVALDLDRADLALEWLEQGRCLVWNQLGQLRTPIDELRIKNQDLADRFIEIASHLESDGSRSSMSLSTPLDSLAQKIHQQEITLRHTTHATKYKQLLNEIRSLEDFRDFLKPPQCITILSSIPKDGPIVILHAYDSYCGALALISGADNPLPICLENFSHDDAERLQNVLQSGILHHREVEDGERLSSRRINQKSISYILKELWCKVVRPILEALDLLVPPMTSNRPRLWWCPTGPFSFLPLHASGIYVSDNEPRSCVSDFVISSYTPTVRSVSEKFIASAAPFSHTKLLLVSQPHTPGLSPIPSTTTETHAVQVMMQEEEHIETLLLENAYATVDRVKTEMSSHGWVHFACHGIQNRGDPLQSGVSLHDGRLELLEIIRQKIPNPEFAFLSACQTSKGDLELSDEVVHLAAGMLASGYRGVVGTMWSISDHYGPEFAELFYQYLLSNNRTGGLDSTRAAYALDYATRQMRERLGDSETSFLTWVPYVHYGY